MELQDIINKATIEFPRPLNLKESNKLLKYISKNLPGNVNSNIEQHKVWLYDKEKNKSRKDNGTLKIYCNINNSNKPDEFDSMVLESWKEDSSYIGSIKFKVDDDDQRVYKRVFPLWDNVRDIVNDYFRK
jgi:hypothetical protein